MAVGLLAIAHPVMANPTEPEMMAEYIERFTLFIDWPPLALGGAGDPFVLCVVGPAPIREPLIALARQRPLKGHRAVVRTVDAARHPESIASCHVAFIDSSEARRLPLLLEHVVGRPVLTVSNAPGFGVAGVCINIYREAALLRFEINSGAARSAGLVVRARLQRLARPERTP